MENENADNAAEIMNMPKEELAGKALLSKEYTIACAESCTGGLLTSRLTDIAGSSAYVMGSIVSYDNTVKMNQVGVLPRTLEVKGAVSPETAAEMAAGVRKKLKTNIGVGITGIAGPGGGTADKPVGLVYIAVAGPRGTMVKRNQFTTSQTGNAGRKDIKWQTSEKALEMLLDYLQFESKELIID